MESILSKTKKLIVGILISLGLIGGGVYVFDLGAPVEPSVDIPPVVNIATIPLEERLKVSKEDVLGNRQVGLRNGRVFVQYAYKGNAFVEGSGGEKAQQEATKRGLTIIRQL